MAEKISISEIYDPSELFPPYVNMAYDIQNYSNHFCGSQTYNLPGVYLSNLLIYNLMVIVLNILLIIVILTKSKVIRKKS